MSTRRLVMTQVLEVNDDQMTIFRALQKQRKEGFIAHLRFQLFSAAK